jgi:phosphate transport system substrate-binding protein
MRGLTSALIAAAVVAAPASAAETVRIKGSETIGGALAPALATAFEKRYPGIRVTVESLGSGTAFVGLLDGSADLGASSRAANAKELEQAAARGATLREFVLGYDGIAVIVHPTNPVDALTVAQVSDLFTGVVQSWDQVGGQARPVRRISRPTYSGTYAFFKEKALRKGNSKGSEEFSPDTQYLEENPDIVAAVAADPTAVAYVGLGWVDRRVKALALAPTAGAEAVPPSLEAIRHGTYPIYRPLFFYTLGEPTGASRAFLRFSLSEEGRRIVAAHDFVPSDQPITLPELASPSTRTSSLAATTYRVSFTAGSTSLSPQAQETLRRVAERVREGSFRVLVVGHADTRGTPAANRTVSQARAQTVAQFLRQLGVPSALMQVEARGAEEPVATNETPAGRSANRRVDVTLVPTSHP